MENFRFSRTEFDKARTYIISINGVVESVVDIRKCKSSESLQRQIVETINRLIDRGKHVLFVSNDSRRSRQELARRLINLGINLPEETARDHVWNTAFTCAWFLNRAGLSKPFVICS